MKKINKFLILIGLISVVFSCGKKEDDVYFITDKKIESKEELEKIKDEIRNGNMQNDEINIDELINVYQLRDKHLETLSKVLQEDINSKIGIYNKFLVTYKPFFFNDEFYYAYKEAFLDNKNNFVKSDDKKVNQFLLKVSKIDYTELETSLKNLEKYINEAPKYESYDKYASEVSTAYKNWKANTERIINYYKSGEYKKDGFLKGQNLNKEYVLSINNRKETFKNFYKYNSELKYELEKTYVIRYKKRNDFMGDLHALNLLMTIFNDRMYDWYELSNLKKLNMVFSLPSSVKNREKYISDLKKINEATKRIIENLKSREINFEELDYVNKDIYKDMIKQGEENIKLAEKIISNIEKNKFDEVNKDGIDYMNNRISVEISLKKKIIDMEKLERSIKNRKEAKKSIN